MNYTLTKYLTSDYFRENEFTKAFLELVDEIIFCCYMESREIISQLSFEDMDDNYFLTFQDFFLNGLSTLNIENLDKIVLSEWFSLLHVRGELSDLSKLFKFGGSLTTDAAKNNLILYNNADVPEKVTPIGVDGIIYAVTEENVNLTEDYFINQQIPAGYRIGVIRQPPPYYVHAEDKIDLKIEKSQSTFVIDWGVIDVHKEKYSDIEFYRRRQFDQTYSFKQLFQSGYTINELSQFHQNATFYFGYDAEVIYAEPTIIDETKDIYTGIGFASAQFLLEEGIIEEPNDDFILSGTFVSNDDFVGFSNVDGYNGYIEYIETQRNNYRFIENEIEYPESDYIEYNCTQRNNYTLEDSIMPFGGSFASNYVLDGQNVTPEFIPTQVQSFVDVTQYEPEVLIQDMIVGGDFVNLPLVHIYSDSQTAESIPVDSTFDTGLPYNSNELYMVITSDEQGNQTLYGWEPEESNS